MAVRSAPAPAATPILQGVRTGLLRSAGPLLADRWGTGGISYRPNTSFPGESYDPCGTPGATPDEEGAIEWAAWSHLVASKCSALSAGAEGEAEESARVVQRYTAEISHMVERVFWTGDLDDGTSFAGNGWDNRPLADMASDDLTGVGPVGVVTAFNFAFEYLADTVGGLRGMIHVPYKLLPYLSFYGVAIRDGFSMVTTLADHIVVAGTGYDGSAPDGSPAEGGTVWIYVTTPVRAAATDPVAQVGLGMRGDESNNWVASATGMALAEWDLQAHAALQVCIPDPGPSCEPGVS